MTSEVIAALTAADAWLKLLCDTMDIEPTETFAHVTAKDQETGLSRKLAKLSLADAMVKISVVLSKAKGA